MNINFNNIIKHSLLYVFVIVFSFFTSSILYIYLPKVSPIILDTKNNNLVYYRYNIKYSFLQDKQVLHTSDIINNKTTYKLIDNIILKAIFMLDNNKGFVVVLEKDTSKSYTLNIGNYINKYKLILINANSAVFLKDGIKYKLEMNSQKNSSQNYIINSYSEDIKLEDDKYILTKKLIDRYTTNFDLIWKNISINEIKNGDKIIGFKILNISKDSVFDKIGLKMNDIILSVNNIKLDSYAQAFKIYENIENISHIHMIIERDKKQMELDYEIK
jgi:general secretion pathway protein C